MTKLPSWAQSGRSQWEYHGQKRPKFAAKPKEGQEWKGEATYWDVVVENEKAERGAWSYPKPFQDFYKIKSYLAFYPSKMDCYVNGEHVKPQPGGFYGGWITKEIVGPVKGESDETYL